MLLGMASVSCIFGSYMCQNTNGSNSQDLLNTMGPSDQAIKYRGMPRVGDRGSNTRSRSANFEEELENLYSYNTEVDCSEYAQAMRVKDARLKQLDVNYHAENKLEERTQEE